MKARYAGLSELAHWPKGGEEKARGTSLRSHAARVASAASTRKKRGRPVWQRVCKPHLGPRSESDLLGRKGERKEKKKTNMSRCFSRGGKCAAACSKYVPSSGKGGDDAPATDFINALPPLPSLSLTFKYPEEREDPRAFLLNTKIF